MRQHLQRPPPPPQQQQQQQHPLQAVAAVAAALPPRPLPDPLQPVAVVTAAAQVEIAVAPGVFLCRPPFHAASEREPFLQLELPAAVLACCRDGLDLGVLPPVMIFARPYRCPASGLGRYSSVGKPSLDRGFRNLARGVQISTNMCETSFPSNPGIACCVSLKMERNALRTSSAVEKSGICSLRAKHHVVGHT